MNQLCKVCGEPAAGFHFGAFTCEGCKSFFGRTYNNISAIAGCKNAGDCVINKKNRTACKACRLRKCLLVGMSKSGSRYGRRSNWFKIHCLLQETQQTTQPITGGGGVDGATGAINNFEQLARLHQMQARQTYQDKTNPCIKTASMSPLQSAELPAGTNAISHSNSNSHHHHHHSNNNNNNNNNVVPTPTQLQEQQMQYIAAACASAYKTDSRLSDDTASDSGASSAYGDADADDCRKKSRGKQTSCHQFGISSQAESGSNATLIADADERNLRHKEFLQIFRSQTETFRNHPFSPFGISLTHLHPPSGTIHPSHILPALKRPIKCKSSTSTTTTTTTTTTTLTMTPALEAAETQDEPIDLSFGSIRHTAKNDRLSSPAAQSSEGQLEYEAADTFTTNNQLLLNVIQKPAPLDLTLTGSE